MLPLSKIVLTFLAMVGYWIKYIASTRKHTRSHKRSMFQSRILHVPAVLRAIH